MLIKLGLGRLCRPGVLAKTTSPILVIKQGLTEATSIFTHHTSHISSNKTTNSRERTAIRFKCLSCPGGTDPVPNPARHADRKTVHNADQVETRSKPSRETPACHDPGNASRSISTHILSPRKKNFSLFYACLSPIAFHTQLSFLCIGSAFGHATDAARHREIVAEIIQGKESDGELFVWCLSFS